MLAAAAIMAGSSVSPQSSEAHGETPSQSGARDLPSQHVPGEQGECPQWALGPVQ